MKSFYVILLVGSLIVNAWLLQRTKTDRGARNSDTIHRTPASASAPVVVMPGRLAPPVIAEGIANALAGGDVAILRDTLEGAGADATTVRALVEGVLRRRLEVQSTAWRIDQIKTSWWRGGAVASDGRAAPSARGLFQEPLLAALGPDPLDLADSELRYDYLPPEKRRMLAMIDLDYGALTQRSPMIGNVEAANQLEVDEREFLAEERRKDILVALTPEEHAEYELRTSDVSYSNARRFAAMEATEMEFRSVIPLIETLSKEMRSVPFDQPNAIPLRTEMEQRTMDQLVAAIGYERTVDYIWGAGSGPYLPTVRLMRELNLPATHAAQLLQLAAETGVKGASVHHDRFLTADQKRAALARLQSEVRPQFDALVPPAAQSRLPLESIAWFDALGEGRYAPHYVNVASATWFSATPISVTVPPQTPLRPVPLPRRSGN